MRARTRIKIWRGEALFGLLWMLRFLCRPRGLRRLYLAVIMRLIKKTRLFDRAWYSESNHDVARASISPLRHYAACGDREGRWPMPLFDPNYYRSRSASRTRHVNTLLHYAWIGRYQCISPSSWFDVHYYLSQNKDVARSGMEPLYHYLKYGGLEMRSPNPQFDGAYYLRHNPDVAVARLNPLLHYLQYGHYAGLPTRPANEPGADEEGRLPQPEAESALAWQEVQPIRGRGETKVDVIIPVYKDRGLTLRCLFSLLTAKCEVLFEPVVINDASPDPLLVADLERLAGRGLFTLLHNDTNRGFVHTVNRGFALHPQRDVVLLNADTEVYGNWLDRLRTAALRHPRTATVTPLSNNATICSYPRFLHDNPYPLETDYKTLDRQTARVNAGVEVEAPTGVGFCMYLRRDALADVGPFDETAFGKGYGEENDFCQRAIARRWRNVIAADIFVRHLGGASFQGEKTQRIAASLKVLVRRHPGYHKAVEEFIGRDPLAAARRRLDWERLKGRSRQENVLIVCHSRGGGAERHVQEDTQRLRQEGKGVFYLRPERGRPSRVRLGHPACRQLLNLGSVKLAKTKALAAILKELRITRIHSHGLVDFTADAPKQLQALVQLLKVPLHVDVHDYKIICPRLNLVDQHGRYCGEPDEAACDNCLTVHGNDFGVNSIRGWRNMHRRVLRSVEAVWVPDADVAERLARYYPEIKCVVTPHDSQDAEAVKIRPPVLQGSEPLRVVVIGAISKIKGFAVLLACARDAQKRRLPIEFVVMGYSLNDCLLEQAGVVVTGRYCEHEAEEKLRSLSPHAVWFPALWPETYSYTLSLALKCGCKVFAFDLGAIARRLRDTAHAGGLLPLTLADDPRKMNQRFMKYRTAHLSAQEMSREPAYEMA